MRERRQQQRDRERAARAIGRRDCGVELGSSRSLTLTSLASCRRRWRTARGPLEVEHRRLGVAARGAERGDLGVDLRVDGPLLVEAHEPLLLSLDEELAS